jgi:hypothetical protein
MKMLADLLIAQPYMRLDNNRLVDSTPLAKIAHRAERYVLDEQTTRMLVRLANCWPRRMKQVMEIAWPAAPDVWIEWPSFAMLDERRKIQGPDWEFTLRQPEASTAALIALRDGHMHINCIEHDETCRGVFPWLVGFKVFKEPRDDQPLDDACAVWGYTRTTPGVESMRGYAIPSLHPDLIAETRKRDMQKIMINELAGFVRVTLTALALLASPATLLGPPVRPRGRFVGKGGATHPYQPRRFVELALPKRVRNAQAFVERTLTTQHRKLHEVRAHYRHFKYQPNAPGWEPIEIEGEKLWRKPIARHLRGDPDLGVVEHAGVHVKGPSQ